MTDDRYVRPKTGSMQEPAAAGTPAEPTRQIRRRRSTSPANPANANGHRRRQLRARVLAEETHCALCGLPVDKTLTWWWGHHSRRCRDAACPGCVPHPKRAEVDEIIPRAAGGDPLRRDNCRLTHRGCNLNRSIADAGHRPAVDRTNPYPTTTPW